jgi:hypothetical protein
MEECAKVIRDFKIQKAKEGNTWAMGDLFEKKASEMFPEKNFSIVMYTPRREDIPGRMCENAKNPDFLFKDKKTGEKFWVECKFRTSTTYGKVIICKRDRMDQYIETMKETKTPFWFLIGLQGEPSQPERIYIINLKETMNVSFDPETIEWYNHKEKFDSLEELKNGKKIKYEHMGKEYEISLEKFKEISDLKSELDEKISQIRK